MLRVIDAADQEPWALRSNDVHLWFLDPAAIEVASVRTAALSILSDAEAARHQQLQLPIVGDAFLATRLLVRTVLSRYCLVESRSLQFRLSATGKPELTTPAVEPPLRFNLSNTRGLVACAVMLGRDIGVDVEALREPPRHVAETVFAPIELESINGAAETDRRRTFFTLWTLKESFLKATGDGLSMPLREFAVATSPPRLLQHRRGAAECARWHFAAFSPTPSHVLALCVGTSELDAVRVIPRWLTTESLLAGVGAIGV
jgi:4'-phosphopantetheinyl transferase